MTTKNPLSSSQRLFSFKKGCYIDFKAAFTDSHWHREDFIQKRQLEHQIEAIQTIRLECITCPVSHAHSQNYPRYLRLLHWLQQNTRIHLDKVPFQWPESRPGLEAELDAVHWNFAVWMLKLAPIHAQQVGIAAGSVEALKAKHLLYAKALGVAQERRGREFELLKAWLAYLTHRLYWEKAKREAKASAMTMAKLASACVGNLEDCCVLAEGGGLSERTREAHGQTHREITREAHGQAHREGARSCNSQSPSAHPSKFIHCSRLRDFWRGLLEFYAASWFYGQRSASKPAISQALQLIEKAKTTFTSLLPNNSALVIDDDENVIGLYLTEFLTTAEHLQAVWMKENNCLYFSLPAPEALHEWEAVFEGVNWIQSVPFAIEEGNWEEFDNLLPEFSCKPKDSVETGQSSSKGGRGRILPVSSAISFLTIGDAEAEAAEKVGKKGSGEGRFPAHIPRPGAWRPLGGG